MGQAAEEKIRRIYCFKLQTIATTLNKHDKETHDTGLKALKVIAKARRIEFQLRPKMEGLKQFDAHEILVHHPTTLPEYIKIGNVDWVMLFSMRQHHATGYRP
jgi:hypothetical protein